MTEIRFLRCTAAVVGLLAVAASAAADIVAGPAAGDQPPFTAEELVLIRQHPALQKLFNSDPQELRRLIDEALGIKPGDGKGKASGKDGQGRSSPEASYDLLQILKQAGGGQKGVAR